MKAAPTMHSINFVYRGCTVNIEIRGRATLWDVTIDVTPFDGVELIEPFGEKKLKLARVEQLDAIQSAVIEEVCMAIDHRLVGC